VVYHTTKANHDNVFDTFNSTTGLPGAVDSMLIVKKEKEYSVLHATGRDLKSVEKAIEFDSAKCAWKMLGEASTFQMSAPRAVIVDAIKQGATTLTAIAELTGMKIANVKPMFGRMVADQTFEKTGHGKYDLFGGRFSTSPQFTN